MLRKIVFLVLLGGLFFILHAYDIGIDSIISPNATHIVNTPINVIARLRRYDGGGPTNFPAICSIVSSTGYVRYTNTQTVVWQEPLDTTRVIFTSWTPTITELCTVKVSIIYPDSNPLNNRMSKTVLIGPWLPFEGFESATFPPTGWQSIILNGTYNWQRFTAGVNPTCTPYEGIGMAGYLCFNATSGSCARLISPPIDFGSIPHSGLLKFHMYHDNGYPGGGYGPDSVKVEYSSDGTNFIQVASFVRYSASGNAWVEHTVNLYMLSGIIYIGLSAFSQYGNNIYIDNVRLLPIYHDVGVDSIISPQSFHQAGTAITPIARVKNYGCLTEYNFPVVCSIIGANGTLRYTNTQNVSLLAPSQTTLVNFSTWTPTITECCTVKMRTNLSGDENPLNDRKTGITQIYTNAIYEGFNDTIFPPPGWQANIITGPYNWGRYTSCSNPPCSPYEGPGMAGVRVPMTPVMCAARLITPPISLSSLTNCTLKFFMMHDPAYSIAPDSIKIETSTNGTTFNRITAFSRYGPTVAWVEHSVNLGNLSGTVYIGFAAYWGSGYDMNIDFIQTIFPGIEENSFNGNVSLSDIRLKSNPVFNSLARISFTLAEPSQVSLKIIDVSGRLVKNLVNEHKSAGVYSVNWNCRDDNNRRVAEGIYFYSLETSKQKFTKKMILIQN